MNTFLRNGVEFDERDRQCLSLALTEVAEARLFRRVQAVLLVARGQCFAAAAQTTGLSLRSVYYLVRRYQESRDVASLKDRPRSGRPRLMQVAIRSGPGRSSVAQARF